MVFICSALVTIWVSFIFFELSNQKFELSYRFGNTGLPNPDSLLIWNSGQKPFDPKSDTVVRNSTPLISFHFEPDCEIKTPQIISKARQTLGVSLQVKPTLKFTEYILSISPEDFWETKEGVLLLGFEKCASNRLVTTSRIKGQISGLTKIRTWKDLVAVGWIEIFGIVLFPFILFMLLRAKFFQKKLPTSWVIALTLLNLYFTALIYLIYLHWPPGLPRWL